MISSKKNYYQYRIRGLYLSIVFIAISLLGLFSKGLNFGIDFSGGYITEFSTSVSIDQVDMQQLIKEKINGEYILTSAEGETLWSVREPDNDENTAQAKTSKNWLNELSSSTEFESKGINVTPLDSDYLDSQVGKELIEQGGLAMLTALIIILIYLSARFEWRFALGAILALFHDLIVVLGVFAWTQLEFNLTVLASLLAIVGYSLNDSIIVADRIRELMRVNNDNSLSQLINTAIGSTLTRTLITSGTTLTTISAVWWLAGASLEGFSVALFAGILVGTFSSVCISATFPELVGLKVDFYKTKKELEQDELAAP